MEESTIYRKGITMNENPKIVIGDKIILVKGVNQNKYIEGKISTVRRIHDNGSFQVICEDNGSQKSYNIFNTPPSDVYCLANTEDRIKACKRLVSRYKKAIKEQNMIIDFLEKYKSKDEWLDVMSEKLIKAKTLKEKKALLDEIKVSKYF